MNLKKLLFILIKLLLTPIKVLFYLNSILIQLTTNYYIRRTFILNESEYKIQLIKNIAKFYNYESFIETGTPKKAPNESTVPFNFAFFSYLSRSFARSIAR
jgi:uncharacterized protein YxeA